MYTISFIQRKGGVGKSTLACILSTYLSKSKKEVLLLDLDPQKSSSNWVEKSKYDINYLSIKSNDEFTQGYKQAQDSTIDYLIIDTAGFEGDVNVFVMGKSDFVILPVGNSEEDLRGAQVTLSKIHQVQEMRGDNKPKPYILFNNVNPKTSLFTALKEAVNGLNEELLAIIPRRVALQEIFTTYEVPLHDEEVLKYVNAVEKRLI